MTKAQKYREGFSSTMKCSSVKRTTRLESPFGCSTKDFDIALRPGEDIPSWCFVSAGCQVLDLSHRKFPVPYVQICQLTDIGLRGIKASPECVLWNQVEMFLLLVKRDTCLQLGTLKRTNWLQAEA